MTFAEFILSDKNGCEIAFVVSSDKRHILPQSKLLT